MCAVHVKWMTKRSIFLFVFLEISNIYLYSQGFGVSHTRFSCHDRYKPAYYVDIESSIRYHPTKMFAILERLKTPNAVSDRGALILDDFEQLLEAIEIFYTEFGDFDIPVKFEVPDAEPWPSRLHGLRLGKRLEKLFTTPEFFNAHPDKVQQIASRGLKPDISSLVDDWEILIKSLAVFKKLYGHCRVPSKFVVPDDDIWPRVCRNSKLGVRVAAIRSTGRFVRDHPDRKNQLDQLAFEWSIRDSPSVKKEVEDEELFQQVINALIKYKNIYGDCVVPLNFTTPVNNDEWGDVQGFSLGSYLQSIRKTGKFISGKPEREETLIEIGFAPDEGNRAAGARKKFEAIYNALVTYKSLYGDVNVPQPFVVPDEEPWPLECRGLKLGTRIYSIRTSSTFINNNQERRYACAVILL